MVDYLPCAIQKATFSVLSLFLVNIDDFYLILTFFLGLVFECSYKPATATGSNIHTLPNNNTCCGLSIHIPPPLFRFFHIYLKRF